MLTVTKLRGFYNNLISYFCHQMSLNVKSVYENLEYNRFLLKPCCVTRWIVVEFTRSNCQIKCFNGPAALFLCYICTMQIQFKNLFPQICFVTDLCWCRSRLVELYIFYDWNQNTSSIYTRYSITGCSECPFAWISWSTHRKPLKQSYYCSPTRLTFKLVSWIWKHSKDWGGGGVQHQNCPAVENLFSRLSSCPSIK